MDGFKLFSSFLTIVIVVLLFNTDGSPVSPRNSSENVLMSTMTREFSLTVQHTNTRLLIVRLKQHETGEIGGICFDQYLTNPDLLAHLVCRQLNHETYLTYDRFFNDVSDHYSVKVRCNRNYQQSFQECVKVYSQKAPCSYLFAITCDECKRVISPQGQGQYPITSPGYPNSQIAYLHCEWRISLPSVNFDAHIQFDEVGLPDASNDGYCLRCSVEVLSLDMTTGQLSTVQRICGRMSAGVSISLESTILIIINYASGSGTQEIESPVYGFKAVLTLNRTLPSDNATPESYRSVEELIKLIAITTGIGIFLSGSFTLVYFCMRKKKVCSVALPLENNTDFNITDGSTEEEQFGLAPSPFQGVSTPYLGHLFKTPNNYYTKNNNINKLGTGQPIYNKMLHTPANNDYVNMISVSGVKSNTSKSVHFSDEQDNGTPYEEIDDEDMYLKTTELSITYNKHVKSPKNPRY